MKSIKTFLEKYKITSAIITITIVLLLPILLELILRFLLYHEVCTNFIVSFISWIKSIFPTKEIFWTAYTGLITGTSVLIAVFQPIYSKRNERESMKEDLLENLKNELLTNWNYLSNPNMEVHIDKNAYNKFIRYTHLFKDEISKVVFDDLIQIYNNFSVFEYRRDHFYNRKYSFGKKEVGDNILMRDLAIKTFESRYQCFVDLTVFILDINEKEKKYNIPSGNGITEGVYPRQIKRVRDAYARKIKTATLDKLSKDS